MILQFFIKMSATRGDRCNIEAASQAARLGTCTRHDAAYKREVGFCDSHIAIRETATHR